MPKRWYVYAKDKKTGDLQLIMLHKDGALRYAAFDRFTEAVDEVERLLAVPENANKEYVIRRR